MLYTCDLSLSVLLFFLFFSIRRFWDDLVQTERQWNGHRAEHVIDAGYSMSELSSVTIMTTRLFSRFLRVTNDNGLRCQSSLILVHSCRFVHPVEHFRENDR